MNPTIVRPFRSGAAQRTRFGYLTGDHPTLDRLQNTISIICGILAGLAILAMVILTLIDVTARTVFGAPLGWTVSFIETHLMVAAAFFGIVTAYRSGAHVAVASLFHRFPHVVQKWLLLFSHLLVAVGFGALFVAGIQETIFAVETNQRPIPGSSELMIPVAVWRSYIPLATGLGLILVLIDFWRELVTPWDRLGTDYDPGDQDTENRATDSEPGNYDAGDRATASNPCNQHVDHPAHALSSNSSAFATIKDA